MRASNKWIRGLSALAIALAIVQPASGTDELRGLKKGEPVPAYRLPAIDGSVVDSATLDGSVVVLVCLSAEQRRSELAALESVSVVQELDNEAVRLFHVTADVIQKSYFEAFRAERSITTPLALDADRGFLGKLGVIVLPTTIIVDREGKLAHVIPLHSSGYKQVLSAEIRHALGELSDDELEQRTAAVDSTGSPKSFASAHRALARSMREKGLLDAAKGELLKAREADPDNHEVILDLCDLDLVLGDLDEADELVDRVLRSQPNHRRAGQFKGIILFKRGEYDAAERMLTESLTLNPHPEVAQYYLGQICERKGQIELALEHYRAALQHVLDEP
ncbi:MAG: tetratricopeptide repeat protein [Phycisphaerales bacterium]|nr:tetratricopeptide repeat protein [Phycisphaerales bacterium]